jgi:hypothetical protein
MDMAENELIRSLNKNLDTGFNEDLALPELNQNLVDFINSLIINDFSKLVTILYRVDVDENKLKKILKEQAGTDAAQIIAGLIIEREQQKAETRKKFRG